MSVSRQTRNTLPDRPSLVIGRLLLPLAALALIAACSDELSRARPYVLTTATTGGVFYPVGVAIATIAHAELSESENISMTAISSAGSMENLKLLRDNQAQFAILQGPFGAWSWNGEGPVREPQSHIRSVSALWKNVEHFVLLAELVSTGGIMDLNNLDGERYVLGARNSGAEQTGRFILETLGVDYEEKFSLAYMGYGPTVGAIQDGNIVGMNIPAGAPVSSITQAYAMMGERMTILNWTQQELDLINSRYPLWDWYDFPPLTYPNQTEPVRTVASPNVLVTRVDIPEEAVYRITRVIWENLATLQEIHGATRDMRPEIAIAGLGAPLHAGALRYYREVGLEIPERLLLEEPSTGPDPETVSDTERNADP
ncbi:MAG: TAXI family TRAP transporter solute-binding subunit [Gammaproteobacteria bacterium]|nr:TAXI family TRAP transporter solute-binding subunit [Gammaproteobacteria bacterium]MYH85268.1 TAXI family TRAP transporter solute-binding subunit [Gammaproteobacteria bacterium]MYK04964.1 TAXI family TRAP transporter solute-binding subunit [Gammaproteobacteria bacterium]